MVKVHRVEQGSNEWHQLRAGKYTGASAHKLLKFGAIDYSLTNSGNFRGNFWTKRGHILEEEAIELYETIKKVSIDRPGFVTNSRYPDCGYSPDGLAPDRIIEVKSFDEKKHLEIYHADPESIPITILGQVHFGMFICEIDSADLVIYNPNLEAKLAFKIIHIESRPNIKANFKRILTKQPQGVSA